MRKLLLCVYIGLFSISIIYSQVTNDTDVDIDKKYMVFADYNSISTIIKTLLNNSIKFNNENSLITIKLINIPDYVQLTISDNGIGMPQKQVNELFDQETFISTPGTNQEKGSGLGLMLVSQFIKMNKGKIEVESKEGFETSFTVSIPEGQM
ncbi:MAG: hypothetical protein B6I20_12070 [Bacteroidetes bacterium 4572_117]|nr:MAG: hypothetical protein B6I20_12070 [Bacteroidetes bacterium 4572_117]